MASLPKSPEPTSPPEKLGSRLKKFFGSVSPPSPTGGLPTILERTDETDTSLDSKFFEPSTSRELRYTFSETSPTVEEQTEEASEAINQSSEREEDELFTISSKSIARIYEWPTVKTLCRSLYVFYELIRGHNFIFKFYLYVFEVILFSNILIFNSFTAPLRPFFLILDECVYSALERFEKLVPVVCKPPHELYKIAEFEMNEFGDYCRVKINGFLMNPVAMCLINYVDVGIHVLLYIINFVIPPPLDEEIPPVVTIEEDPFLHLVNGIGVFFNRIRHRLWHHVSSE